MIDVCERVESRIRGAGFLPAFPVNISIDDVAAHYTSPPDDQTSIPKGSIVKLDAGLRLDGYIVDAARTVAFDRRHKGLVDCARAALRAAGRVMREGVRLQRVGEAIYDVAKRRGYRPVSNLSGHKIEYYTLHSGIEVPNVPARVGYRLKAGDVFAVEPFVTTSKSKGLVKGLKDALIYSLRMKLPSTNPVNKKIMDMSEEEFKGLPFAERWLLGITGKRVDANLRSLVRRRVFRSYSILAEASGGPVAQAEDTFLITKEGVISLTSG